MVHFLGFDQRYSLQTGSVGTVVSIIERLKVCTLTPVGCGPWRSFRWPTGVCVIVGQFKSVRARSTRLNRSARYLCLCYYLPTTKFSDSKLHETVRRLGFTMLYFFLCENIFAFSPPSFVEWIHRKMMIYKNWSLFSILLLKNFNVFYRIT